MRCSLGSELHQQYQLAERAKFDLNSRRIQEGTPPPSMDKELISAKQFYVETFANWLSHQAFCHHCKPGAFTRKGELLSPLDK